jgi:signal transduction histidine kinase
MSSSAAVLPIADHAASAGSFTTLVRTTQPQPQRRTSTGESTLLATVAHELRNPLASLRLSLEMLVEDFDQLPSDRALEMIQRSQRSVAYLYGLVENLTSSAAARHGQLAMQCTPLDLQPVIQGAIDNVRALLTARGQTVVVLGVSEDSQVSGEFGRIVQIITNLLSNASRYSVEGDAIEVHVTASAQRVRVRVVDHGPGIAPEQQQRIFGAWQRGEDAAPGGLGLGLSIVQQLVQQLGGRIGVESTLGQGATFWFTLPRAA